MTTSVVNALTIDVEDYFQVHAFSDVIERADWDSFSPRVERNTYHLLDILDSVEEQRSEGRVQRSESRGQRTEDRGQRTGSNRLESHNRKDKQQRHPESSRTRATFFVLGWVAKRFPDMVKEIHSRGHEVACHGYGHHCIYNQTPEHFREDVHKAKEVLENLIGAEVVGYRAPSFSITKETLWALKVLFELGFYYDSSIFPIRHDFYGFYEAPRFPFFIDFSNDDLLSQFQNPKYLHMIGDKKECNQYESPRPSPNDLCPMPTSGIVEFPLSTITVFGRNLPCAGGGYFRLFPYWYTKQGIKKLNLNGAKPFVFYIHPWELDSDLPVIYGAERLSKFRTYTNQKKTEDRFTRLISEFRFAPLASFIEFTWFNNLKVPTRKIDV